MFNINYLPYFSRIRVENNSLRAYYYLRHYLLIIVIDDFTILLHNYHGDDYLILTCIKYLIIRDLLFSVLIYL